MDENKSSWAYFRGFSVRVSVADEELLARLIHQTTASMERGNDLMCYECNTLRNGPGCNNLSIGDNSTFVSKCKGDKKMCIVSTNYYE